MSNPEFLQACNPSFSICLPKEANYYIDLTAARGENVVKRMRRAIALSSNKHTYQLLSGQIGSGKSTELLRLKFELEQQGFVVIYCAVDQYLQIHDLGLAELWLVILKLILQQLESKGDSISLTYLPNAIAEIEKWMRIIPSVNISTSGQRLQRILQTLQDNDQNRRQLHRHLESRLTNLLIVAIEEVTGVASDRVKQTGKKGLVILVDNLDRLSIEQSDLIFGRGGKYLRQFQCHTIYTLSLLASIHLSEQFQLKGTVPILLPNLQLCDRHDVVKPESLNLLRQVVLSRMLPNIVSDLRLEQVPNCFDHLETLDRLCLASHGHLPYLLSLLQGCLQSQDPPISLDTLNQVLERDQITRLSTISDRDLQALHKCLTSDYAITPEAINLCRRLLLFSHHDHQGDWFS
ncbi:MAG: ATP-binding protein, partial [Pseudanabaena sp.]